VSGGRTGLTKPLGLVTKSWATQRPHAARGQCAAPDMITLPVSGPARILVVDDDVALGTIVAEGLADLGYQVARAESAEEALESVAQAVPDLILTDVHMRGMTGVDLCARVKATPALRLTPVVLLTALSDLDARVAGLAAGADDFFAKPFNFIELRTRVAALLRVKTLVDQLEHAENILVTLGLTIEARDSYTAGHCLRLGRYATAVGRALRVDEGTLAALHLGGYLHDLGKVAVPDAILLKPGRLEPAERTHIQTHAAVGEAMVRGLHTLDAVRPIIRHHHERWDGSGYPDGLAKEAIPIGARIMAVVDVWDALVTVRPYKRALTPAEALTILERETAAGAWDPKVFGAFINVLPTLKEPGPEA
jgi:cyclic di-GMP phosphodiesterase